MATIKINEQGNLEICGDENFLIAAKFEQKMREEREIGRQEVYRKLEKAMNTFIGK